jgi:hypothetical protein
MRDFRVLYRTEDGMCPGYDKAIQHAGRSCQAIWCGAGTMLDTGERDNVFRVPNDRVGEFQAKIRKLGFRSEVA